MNAALSSPGDYIRAQLETRGLSQADLAFVLGVQVQAVNQLVGNRRGISADMAVALARVFDTTAEQILGLQKAFELQNELAKARSPNPRIETNALIIKKYPIRDMKSRGWLDDDLEYDQALARFFDVEQLNEVPHISHAAKKTTYDAVAPVQLAWLQQVTRIARHIVVPRYDPTRMPDVITRLRELTIAPEAARLVPRILSEAGIRFVLVQALPSGKIDGACLWIADSPVIALSMRFDRIDNFWFVLRHELEHVVRGDGKLAPVVDSEIDGDGEATLPEEEVLANRAAADFCVPKFELDSWIARKAPFFSERDLIGFSRRIGTHPGVVAGQLRARTKNYKLFSKHLAKVHSFVAPASYLDGWGQHFPIVR